MLALQVVASPTTPQHRPLPLSSTTNWNPGKALGLGGKGARDSEAVVQLPVLVRHLRSTSAAEQWDPREVLVSLCRVPGGPQPVQVPCCPVVAAVLLCISLPCGVKNGSRLLAALQLICTVNIAVLCLLLKSQYTVMVIPRISLQQQCW